MMFADGIADLTKKAKAKIVRKTVL